MRPKFRIWNKKAKCWTDNSLVHQNGEFVFGYLKLFEHGRYIATFANEYDINDFDVEQYIGLINIDGIELCEGDIVKTDEFYDHDGSDVEPKTRIGVIIFDEGCFCIKMKDRYEWIVEARTWKLIGNTHDNPELLEVK